MDVLIGRTLRGRYRVEEHLGSGAMADVYKVWDNARTCWLAIKVLRPNLVLSPGFADRFQREAEALKRLDHPNVVRFYDIEQDRDVAFLVMEYIEGSTLEARLAEAEGPLPMDEIASITQDVCSALAYAHRMDVVHRDTKPANVLLAPEGRALLSDFGISRLGESPTTTMFPIGTPAYMSPEQCEGKELEATSDIYSLGVVLFEMLTGHRPFQGRTGPFEPGSSRAIFYEHINEAPPSVTDLNPNVGTAVEDVVMRALAKLPQYRHQSAEDLASALTEAVPDVGVRRLTIEAPAGAGVYLDNEYHGDGRVTIEGVANGPHRVDVIQEGFQRYVRRITFPETRHLAPTMVRASHPPTALAPSGIGEGRADPRVAEGPSLPPPVRARVLRGWRPGSLLWLSMAGAIAVAVAAVVLARVGVLPMTDTDSAPAPASPTAAETGTITLDQAFDLLPQMILQEEDIPTGLGWFGSAFFAISDMVAISPDAQLAQRRLESWGFVLGYTREYLGQADGGIFDLLITVWMVEDEQRAQSAFLDQALVPDFPDIAETELPEFPRFGDESLALSLKGPAADSTGAEVQAEGYSVVVRVGQFMAALTTYSPSGKANRADTEELAAALEERMKTMGD
jgi:hypothetical protein